MSMGRPKLYLLRDESQSQHFYFKSISDDGCKACYVKSPAAAHHFTKDQMGDFRRTHSHIKGRTVLLNREVERAQP
jgi:MinD superfamily P-loop ATPase